MWLYETSMSQMITMIKLLVIDYKLVAVLFFGGCTVTLTSSKFLL